MSIITEREWRKRAERASRPHPRCWGAQYLLTRERPFLHDRVLRGLMLLLSCLTAFLLPCVTDSGRVEVYDVAEAAERRALNVRPVSDISYSLPDGIGSRSVTYTREQLLRGKLLLLDGEHPLPKDAPAPNTLSVAAQGKGMVPVRDLGVKCGKETIAALARLFGYARGRGEGSLSVWKGAMSPAEQHELRLARIHEHATRLPLNEAATLTISETDAPGHGELIQEYSVEIRQLSPGGAVDERPLELTEQGRFLLQSAWRFGFARCRTGGGYRFRYVGEAHSTAMTYLDLDLPGYIELLHERRMLTVRRDGRLRFIILCAPMNDAFIEFIVPEGAACDASLDNTGWAVVACTLD